MPALRCHIGIDACSGTSQRYLSYILSASRDRIRFSIRHVTLHVPTPDPNIRVQPLTKSVFKCIRNSDGSEFDLIGEWSRDTICLRPNCMTPATPNPYAFNSHTRPLLEGDQDGYITCDTNDATCKTQACEYEAGEWCTKCAATAFTRNSTVNRFRFSRVHFDQRSLFASPTTFE